MKHEIYLRSHTRILDEKSEQKRGSNRPSQDLRHVVLLDAETKKDCTQSLNFGMYQFCEVDSDGNYACLEEGLFHADDLDAPQLEVLRKYVRNENREKTGFSRPGSNFTAAQRSSRK